jgi:hypothetical protein
MYTHVKLLHAIRLAIFVPTLPSYSMSARGCIGMCSMFFDELSASNRELNSCIAASHFRESTVIRDPSLLSAKIHEKVKLVASINHWHTGIKTHVYGEE